ncbi:hypothetical protein TKK_0005388 [Trichogramma kaykai]|uniref:Fatty acid desaturase domain-containing protein n=1 Tax=Trichogramma kaykai TaxID=54128 RepID=A0ABD2XJM8_9HYME
MAPDVGDGLLCPLSGIGLEATTMEEEKRSKITATPRDEDNDDKVDRERDKVVAEYNARFENEWMVLRDDVKWDMVAVIALYHALALYVLVTAQVLQHKRTILWAIFVALCNAFGVTAGVHRLWTHRSYKANTALRSILMICFFSAGQNSIYQWVRDHRVHHKFSETDADPHNSKRGFFFSHVGWLMLKKHPDVISKGKLIDMSDILADPVVRFGERYFLPLKTLACFVVPILVPVYCWNEDWYHSTMAQVVRHVLSLNATWSVNSWAHMFGNKPYDKEIAPVESRWVSYWSMGEGWHNYHHTFPWDYRAAEIGGGRFNLTALLIDGFARLGWAYDRKEPARSVIERVVESRGDGTHESCAKRQQQQHKD